MLLLAVERRYHGR